MRRTEAIVFALGALGETGKATALTQCADAPAPLGENFVRIGLVADVPDQTVVGRIEDMMQCDSQFDHAQTRAEMTTGDGNGIDRLCAKFFRELRQLTLWQFPKVGWRFDGVEERSF